MKNILFILFCYCLSACNVVKDVDCGGIMCTQEYRSVEVQFVDSDGKPVEVGDFKAVNQRTKKVLSKGKDGQLAGTQGYYVVASDGNLKDISPEGDVVMVSLKNPVSGETESIEFQITGGICNCHVYKVTGPDKYTID
mgnify:CR=1 FL=1